MSDYPDYPEYIREEAARRLNEASRRVSYSPQSKAPLFVIICDLLVETSFQPPEDPALAALREAFAKYCEGTRFPRDAEKCRTGNFDAEYTAVIANLRAAGWDIVQKDG